MPNQLGRSPIVLLLLSVSCATAAGEDNVREVSAADPISSAFLHPWSGDFRRPEEISPSASEVRFPNASGNQLRAWHFSTPKSRQTILVCMGNTGNISVMLPYADILQNAGFNVLLFDYQGFGESEGAPAVGSLLTDGIAAFDYLVDEHGQSPEDIGVFGVSLGSIPAITLAAERNAGAVAVEDVFIPKDHLDQYRQQVAHNNPLALFAVNALETLLLSRTDPIENIKKLDVPVLFMHGCNDRLLPPSGTLRVSDVCTAPKRIWLMSDTGHAPESLEVNDREYSTQLVTFFQEAFDGQMSGLDVSIESVATEDQVSVSVTASSRQSTERWPVQLSFASSDGKFHFERVWMTTDEVVSVQPPFKPTHVSAVRIHHVQRDGADSWKPHLSQYSEALAAYKSVATPVFTNEGLADVLCGGGGFSYYNFRPFLPLFSREKEQRFFDQLPPPESVPDRIRPRYAKLLARLCCWPENKLADTSADYGLRFARMMLPYFPKSTDDYDRYYELGNARFDLGFKDSAVGDALFRLAKHELREGNVDAARAFLRQHVSVLPVGVPTNLTEERINSVSTLSDITSDE